MSVPRRYESGPGFVRAKECPDCGHTRCGENCACNCDAAHAEHDAALRIAALESSLTECRTLAEKREGRIAKLRAALEKARISHSTHCGVKMFMNNSDECTCNAPVHNADIDAALAEDDA